MSPFRTLDRVLYAMYPTCAKRDDQAIAALLVGPAMVVSDLGRTADIALPGARSQSLEDRDFKALRDILQGELLPGQRLGQEELSTRFGTSRTPLRSALEAHDADRAEQGMLKHLRTTIALMKQKADELES